MAEMSSMPDTELPERFSSRGQYVESLSRFDAALCEGCAVSQATSGQFVHPTLGNATHVFARILAHGRNLIRSLPRSRWCSSEYEDWDFGANAGNFRSIMEAALLFHYLCDADPDPDNQRAIVQLMHLYDLTKRTTIIYGGEMDGEADRVRAEIVGRLKSTRRFNKLPPEAQKHYLKGRWLMLESRENVMVRLGWDKSRYYLLWNLTSQYTHVYSLAFYRIEPNGRGTGIENDFDRGFLALGLETCADVLRGITDALCEHFPNARDVRNGSNSKFSPGPARNLPKEMKRARGGKGSPPDVETRKLMKFPSRCPGRIVFFEPMTTVAGLSVNVDRRMDWMPNSMLTIGLYLIQRGQSGAPNNTLGHRRQEARRATQKSPESLAPHPRPHRTRRSSNS